MVNCEEEKKALMGYVYRVKWIPKALWIVLSEEEEEKGRKKKEEKINHTHTKKNQKEKKKEMYPTTKKKKKIGGMPPTNFTIYVYVHSPCTFAMAEIRRAHWAQSQGSAFFLCTCSVQCLFTREDAESCDHWVV